MSQQLTAGHKAREQSEFNLLLVISRTQSLLPAEAQGQLHFIFQDTLESFKKDERSPVSYIKHIIYIYLYITPITLLPGKAPSDNNSSAKDIKSLLSQVKYSVIFNYPCQDLQQLLSRRQYMQRTGCKNDHRYQLQRGL